MKKIICGVLALMSVFCMGACNVDKGSDTKLSYGVKYIDEVVAAEEGSNRENYFIFNKDGTAEYRVYGSGINVYSYTIKLKYKIVEEENMVFCFYNGIEYDEDDTAKIEATTKVYSFMYTEDFLMSTDGRVYIAEDFLKKELPNLNK